MDFGISLDPIQRHCLEDSEEDENEYAQSINNESEAFIIPGPTVDLDHDVNLIITVGQIPSIFVKSYFTLNPLFPNAILANSVTVFKDKYFSVDRKCSEWTVSEFFDLKCKDDKTASERFSLCVHEQPLASGYCNLWCTKVCSVYAFNGTSVHV